LKKIDGRLYEIMKEFLQHEDEEIKEVE